MPRAIFVPKITAIKFHIATFVERAEMDIRSHALCVGPFLLPFSGGVSNESSKNGSN
ncbi:protein of unknown function [Petrocella atlantisensis]|uniref:Uncharacterized protein n=1 Tax=Petrocella atlantisensis TaxID=2173034 RepID=A0A3P7RX71_9FIRM|nr:protein of unknown function [Petrocella atlantisensis]